MALHQIFHKILTLGLSAGIIGLTSCEMEVDDSVLPEGTMAGVLKCVIDMDGEVTVYVTGSVSYADTALYTTLGETRVRMSVNGEIVAERTLPAGEAKVGMGRMDWTAGDEVTIDTDSPTTGIAMSGTARKMSTVPIEDLTIKRGETDNTINIALRMTDDKATDDYYQVEVHRTSYSDGEATDTVMNCTYVSAAFSSYSSYGSPHLSGLFTDERLTTNRNVSRKSSLLSLNVTWDDLTRPMVSDAADSMEIAVRLYHHSEEYFNFLSTINMASSFVLLPVFGTTNISSNVTGGYGIVSLLAYDERRITMKRDYVGM